MLEKVAKVNSFAEGKSLILKAKQDEKPLLALLLTIRFSLLAANWDLTKNKKPYKAIGVGKYGLSLPVRNDKLIEELHRYVSPKTNWIDCKKASGLSKLSNGELNALLKKAYNKSDNEWVKIPLEAFGIAVTESNKADNGAW